MSGYVGGKVPGGFLEAGRCELNFEGEEGHRELGCWCDNGQCSGRHC